MTPNFMRLHRQKTASIFPRLWLAWCMALALLLALAVPAQAAITAGTISFGTGHSENMTPVSNENGLSFATSGFAWMYASSGGSVSAFTNGTGDAIRPRNGSDNAPSTADIVAVTPGDRFTIKSFKVASRGANTKVTLTGYRGGRR